MNAPLRYRIDSWDSLTKCLSNTSRDLWIDVNKAISNDKFCGTVISVKHLEFGTLFACVVDGQGELLDNEVPMLAAKEILNQLALFGFYVEFSGVAALSTKQLKLLKSAYDLGMNKIRVMSVYGSDVESAKTYIVAFDDAKNGDWLNNMYSPSRDEFSKALLDGVAANISAASKKDNMNWSWLEGSVMNIYDILTSHGEQLSQIGGI